MSLELRVYYVALVWVVVYAVVVVWRGYRRAYTMVSWWDTTAIDGESGASEFEIGREDSPLIRFMVHGESAEPDGGDDD